MAKCALCHNLWATNILVRMKCLFLKCLKGIIQSSPLLWQAKVTAWTCTHMVRKHMSSLGGRAGRAGTSCILAQRCCWPVDAGETCLDFYSYRIPAAVVKGNIAICVCGVEHYGNSMSHTYPPAPAVMHQIQKYPVEATVTCPSVTILRAACSSLTSVYLGLEHVKGRR